MDEPPTEKFVMKIFQELKNKKMEKAEKEVHIIEEEKLFKTFILTLLMI